MPTDSILFYLTQKEVDYFLKKGKGDVTMAETLAEIDYINNIIK